MATRPLSRGAHLRNDELVGGHMTGHEPHVESKQLHDGEPRNERERTTAADERNVCRRREAQPLPETLGVLFVATVPDSCLGARRRQSKSMLPNGSVRATNVRTWIAVAICSVVRRVRLVSNPTNML
jgi:hypothetical protein